MSTPAHYFIFCCTSSKVCLYFHRINIKGAVTERKYCLTCSHNKDFIAIFFYGSCSVSLLQSVPWSFLEVIPGAGCAEVLKFFCRFSRLISLATHPPSSPSSYSEVLFRSVVLRYVYTSLLFSPLLQSHPPDAGHVWALMSLCTFTSTGRTAREQYPKETVDLCVV